MYGPLCDAIGAVKALRCAVSVGVFLLFFPCVRYLGQHTLALEVATSLFMALRRWGMGDGGWGKVVAAFAARRSHGCSVFIPDLLGSGSLFLRSHVYPL